jgi:hypothetical protein
MLSIEKKDEFHENCVAVSRLAVLYSHPLLH